MYHIHHLVSISTTCSILQSGNRSEQNYGHRSRSESMTKIVSYHIFTLIASITTAPEENIDASLLNLVAYKARYFVLGMQMINITYQVLLF